MCIFIIISCFIIYLYVIYPYFFRICFHPPFLTLSYYYLSLCYLAVFLPYLLSSSVPHIIILLFIFMLFIRISSVFAFILRSSHVSIIIYLYVIYPYFFRICFHPPFLTCIHYYLSLCYLSVFLPYLLSTSLPHIIILLFIFMLFSRISSAFSFILRSSNVSYYYLSLSYLSVFLPYFLSPSLPHIIILLFIFMLFIRISSTFGFILPSSHVSYPFFFPFRSRCNPSSS